MGTHLPRFGTGLAALVIGIAAIGCGGSGGSASGTGTLSVRLADAPDPSVTAVNITVDRVEANVDGAWQPVAVTPQTFNLLDLAKDSSLLGSAALPTGHYGQVRLFVSNPSITDDSGTHNLTIPSGDQTGIKVLVDYDINANNVTTLLLDFDVSHSINKTGAGSYHLKPVVRGVVEVLSGTVSGTVNDAGGAVKGATVTLTPAGATPSDTDPSTLTLEDGTFKFWGVMPGTYTVNVTFTNPDTSVTETGTGGDQTVTADQETNAGTITIAAAP